MQALGPDEVDYLAAQDLVAMVLAAGRGTRMGKLTETVPKPMVPVLGKPALYWVIDGLAAAGVRRFVIVTGWLSGAVRSGMQDYGDAFGLKLSFVHQAEQLGTAHAMKLTREAVGDAPVLLAFADIMTSPNNYRVIIQRFRSDSCEVVGAIRSAGDPWRAAAVYLDDDLNIVRIAEKPEKGTSTTPWSHAGIYCFSNRIYDYIERIKPSARGEYEITDAAQMMIADGLRSQAVELTGYWKDLATPEDIAEAEAMMMAANAGR